jgi:isoquinoline 1-oxidoreductase beta subunit
MKYKAPAYDGLVIAVSVTEAGYVLFSNMTLDPAEGPAPNIWLKICTDNIITVYVGKSEMGQGVCTSLPLILADELGADWGQVRFEASPPGEEYKDPVWGEQATGGSTSVRHMYRPLRKAGAAARQMLLKAASDLWGLPASSCEIAAGSIRNRKTGERLRFGDLSRKAAELPLPKNIRLRRKDGSGLVGTSPPRLDVPDKVNGTALFGADISVPGMLCAAIARAPVYGSRMMLSYEDEASRKIPGVHEIVKSGGHVCVLAETPDAAWKGRDALRIS